VYTLHKTTGPAVDPEALGRIDAVLLSHDHHVDNLDHSGRAFLSRASRILTTPAATDRLGSPAIGLLPWQSVDLPTPDGRILRVTGTPARHGPAGSDRGPVTGFVLAFTNAPEHAVYVSGDTVWYAGVAEVSRRFSVRVALLFLGAARVREVGPAHLTMTADEAVLAARTFAGAVILPLHYEGWEHFSETREPIAAAFRAARLEHRVRWMEAGQPMTIAL
jgi:L-ascorbate metabolism protein UlaG (beta-lactamase superfamily)